MALWPIKRRARASSTGILEIPLLISERCFTLGQRSKSSCMEISDYSKPQMKPSDAPKKVVKSRLMQMILQTSSKGHFVLVVEQRKPERKISGNRVFDV